MKAFGGRMKQLFARAWWIQNSTVLSVFRTTYLSAPNLDIYLQRQLRNEAAGGLDFIVRRFCSAFP